MWFIYYLCNQCLSPLSCELESCTWRGVLITTLCDQVCKWTMAGQWSFPGTPVFSTNKTDRHNMTEILLKVASNTITSIIYFMNLKITGFFSLIVHVYRYLTPVTAIKLKFNLSDNEFKYCFNTLYNDWKHLIMWVFQLLLIIVSSAWYSLVFDEFKDINDICNLIYTSLD